MTTTNRVSAITGLELPPGFTEADELEAIAEESDDSPWAPEPGDPFTYDEDDVTTWSEWLSGTYPPVAHGG